MLPHPQEIDKKIKDKKIRNGRLDLGKSVWVIPARPSVKTHA